MALLPGSAGRHVPAGDFQLNAATVIVAELGDVRRFAHPKNVMAFLGLVPKEETTGNTRHLGSITKAGNAQARWCLIEAIQKALTPPKVSARLSLRQGRTARRVQGSSPGRSRSGSTSADGTSCTAAS